MNEHIQKRMEAHRQSLMNAYESTVGMPSASKGAGRAEFVQRFLSEALPPAYRIRESAAVTDQHGALSGELDIVLENGFAPSFHMPSTQASRLYLAEGVAVAIEVKSDLQAQWSDVVATASKLAVLQKSHRPGGFFKTPGGGLALQAPFKVQGGGFPQANLGPTYDTVMSRIPLIVVGYRGWATEGTLSGKMADMTGRIDAVLQIDTGFFRSSPALLGIEARGWAGPYCLLAAINCIFDCIKDVNIDLIGYAT